MGFQNESFEVLEALHKPLGQEQQMDAIMQQMLKNVREERQTSDPDIFSDMEDYIRDTRQENTTTLENIKDTQEVQPGGIVRETIEKVQDFVEDIVEAVVDFFDGPDESPESDQVELRENIDAAAMEWHVQELDDSCAIVSQQFIINEFTGQNISEADLVEISAMRGWYNGNGTSFEDIGNLLQLFNIDISIDRAADFNDLMETVQNGNRAIVCVQNIALSTEWLDGYPVSSANHAVEVIGIDRSDPSDIKVIVNDPGVLDGRAKAISMANFIDAWQTSGGYMLTAHRN